MASKLDYQLYLEENNLPHPFNIGKSLTFDRGSFVKVDTVLKYPFKTRTYWLAFESENFIWPKLEIKNQGIQSQIIEAELKIPEKFNSGSIVLGIFSDADQELFRKHKEITPLMKPEYKKVLETYINIKEEG